MAARAPTSERKASELSCGCFDPIVLYWGARGRRQGHEWPQVRRGEVVGTRVALEGSRERLSSGVLLLQLRLLLLPLPLLPLLPRGC